MMRPMLEVYDGKQWFEGIQCILDLQAVWPIFIIFNIPSDSYLAFDGNLTTYLFDVLGW